MTIKDCFICPVCGSTPVSIVSAGAFMSDIRLDRMHCNECDSEWNMYSKISETRFEMINRGTPPILDNDDDGEQPQESK